MKTKLFYFFAIALLSGLTVFVSSCSKNDDDKDPAVEETDQPNIDDIDFVRRRLVSLDANGNYKGLLCGVFIDESKPTTAFMSVENLAEAKEVWAGLIPYDAKAVANGENQLVELTDKKGEKQGEMRFNVLDNGKELAEIAFSSPKLIDAHVSRLVFILSSLWPNNDGEYDGPTPVIMTRKSTGTKYAVICMPDAIGNKGYIIHVDKRRYINSREHKKGTGLLMKYFPTAGSLSAIAATIKNNPGLWEVLSQTSGVSVEELQSLGFFTSHTVKDFDYMFNMSKMEEIRILVTPYEMTPTIREEGDNGLPNSWNFPSRVYIMTLQNGVIQLTMDHNFDLGNVPDDVVNELNLTMDDFELEL